MNEHSKYFLGCTSADGFKPYFSDSYFPEDGWKAYILKGGPGTGKSSLLKRVQKRAEDEGIGITLCPCSSDPDSLDAVIIDEKKTVILDGTAPHVAEPKMAGVCDNIVNLAEAFEKQKFEGKYAEISALYKRGATLHAAAGRYMSAAGKLLTDARLLVRDIADSDKAVKAATHFCEKILPKRITMKSGRVFDRFVSVPTVGGKVFLKDTLFMCRESKIIEDEYRAVSPMMLEIIKDEAVKRGFDVIALHDPYLLGTPTEHIIIPELSYGVFTHSRRTDMTGVSASSVTHLRRFAPMKNLRPAAARLRFDRKAAEELIISACNLITKAKLVHDELEKYYTCAVDFSVTRQIGDKVISEIFD